MKEIVSISEVIEKSQKFRKEQYINYFFENIVGFKSQKPVFKDIDETSYSLAIVKDSTDRILNNSRGKLMEKAWRNVIFYFVDKNNYKKFFGTNSFFPNYSIEDDNISYLGNMEKTKSSYPNEPRTNYNTISKLQNHVFKYFRKFHSSWFVRSYVYIVLVVCDENDEISTKDFHTYYWNTNYSFKKLNKKNNIFYNIKDSIFVENIEQEIELIETSNRDAIDCVKAYTGELDFRNDTDENYYYIEQDIKDGIKYILVEGAARTGKTIIAMRILGEFKESIFLIMNYNFYSSLKDAFNILEITFPKNRIYHHSLNKSQRQDGGWIRDVRKKEIIPDLKFLIVDEAQRLGALSQQEYYGYVYRELDEVKVIVDYPEHKHTIFLGDDLQKLNPDTDEGINKIYDKIKGRNFRQYVFKKSIGVPNEILANIKYLLDISGEMIPQATNQFEINISPSIDSFVNCFEEDYIVKKHYVIPGLKEMKGQTIETDDKVILQYPKQLKEQNFPYLFNNEVKSNFLLSTYEVISREVESVYLYLPSEVSINMEQGGFVLKSKPDLINDFLLFHIYTLMTRATLKLTIFCEDDTLQEYLERKVRFINNLNELFNEETDDSESGKNIASERAGEFIAHGSDGGNNTLNLMLTKQDDYDYDLFIAYHGTNDPDGSYIDAKELSDYLSENGVKVFLNNHKCLQIDDDCGFDETWHVIQRSKNFILVFNDNIYKDSRGMIPRKYPDGKPNQLYKELKTFSALVDNDLRTNRKNLRFLYTGNSLTKANAYNFLNTFYIQGTYGNSNCCIFDKDAVLVWINIF
ncbi:DUF2075 domain-containing protein [Mycoplasmatota bacterium]|nr:DUF2075 domain-containing protein [Mycoplasmatota bacterium]